ncbi:MAG: type II toxin-antitoxin system prevent-host-death family antitoxin [Caldilineaceae bacterium]|nr:type II toxin-antitoxin system prevent-host-death family antitoxin [Caldilineaceae bacterium]
MLKTSITELKRSLSAYLRDVQAGEEVLITVRGRPIARLVPVDVADSDADQADSMEEHLADLERRGLIRRRTGKLPEGFWNMPRMKDPEGLVRKGLLRERAEGR